MLLIHCLLLIPMFAGVLVIGRCFVIAVLNGICLNAVNLLRKSELIALSSSQGREAISVLCLFLMLLWAGLQCVLDILTFLFPTRPTLP